MFDCIFLFIHSLLAVPGIICRFGLRIVFGSCCGLKRIGREKENITEDLKKSDVLKWIQRMNNICERVREIVFR